MMKMRKGMAAILAAAITAAAMGSMSAFAATTIQNSAGTADVDLQIKWTDGASTPEVDVWSVTVNETQLQWTITRTETQLVWDAATMTYTGGNRMYQCDNGTAYDEMTFATKDSDYAKNITITNQSNFAVTATTELIEANEGPVSDWFNSVSPVTIQRATAGNGENGTPGTGIITVTPDLSGMVTSASYDGTFHSVGTARISFAKADS